MSLAPGICSTGFKLIGVEMGGAWRLCEGLRGKRKSSVLTVQRSHAHGLDERLCRGGILNARDAELFLGLCFASHRRRVVAIRFCAHGHSAYSGEARGRLVLSGKKPLVALASSGLEAPDARDAWSDV